MCLNLNDYPFKTSRYSYRSTYMNPMVTTNQKHKKVHKNQTERNISIQLKKIIKPEGKKLKEENNREALQKQNKLK